MTAPFSLDAYLARIGYAGPREPSAAVLAEIQRRHVYAIPFENIDVLLGRRIHIDLPAVTAQLVEARRGGYCYQQNTLMAAALEALGFQVTPLSARVRWQVPAEITTPLSHMCLKVTIDGRDWLADGGFGSASLTAPLRLDTEEPQSTPHEARRIRRRHQLVIQQTQLPSGEWTDLYHFTLQPVPRIDYEMANWWSSTYPKAMFTQNLVLALAAEGRRHTIFNREVVTRWNDGLVEKRALATPAELIAVLAEKFGLSLPADTVINIPAAPWPESTEKLR